MSFNTKISGIACVLLALAGCMGGGPSAPPAGRPAADDWVAVTTVPLAQGVASGDVTSRSARVWLRTSGAARVEIEWVPDGEGTGRSLVTTTSSEQDFTATVRLDGLSPGTRYRYRAVARRTDLPSARDIVEESGGGTFRTAPTDEAAVPLTFLWGGDLGGQKRCRDPWVGYPIFYRMLQAKPDFFIMLGDTIYADDTCPSPPNAPGADVTASTLDQYRARHRYQRGSVALQRFLESVPVYAIWDDHEVRNNFSGPADPQMPAGRQALLEYWPIGTPAEDPTRLYRSFRRGADAEFFILDTRQYRDLNAELDGPAKTMLGTAQRDWLIDGLARSTATWKFIVTSVPLSNPKGGTAQMPGNDSWARAADGTGFHTELRAIVHALLKRRVRNVVWLAGDVHYTQVNAYDPNGDGTPDFHEFIAGPLSSAPGKPLPPDTAFKPTTLHSEGGFYNFGLVTVKKNELRLEIVDDTGLPRFKRTFKAQ
jgi:alkaline phosphatase D